MENNNNTENKPNSPALVAAATTTGSSSTTKNTTTTNLSGARGRKKSVNATTTTAKENNNNNNNNKSNDDNSTNSSSANNTCEGGDKKNAIIIDSDLQSSPSTSAVVGDNNNKKQQQQVSTNINNNTNKKNSVGGGGGGTISPQASTSASKMNNNNNNNNNAGTSVASAAAAQQQQNQNIQGNYSTTTTTTTLTNNNNNSFKKPPTNSANLPSQQHFFKTGGSGTTSSSSNNNKNDDAADEPKPKQYVQQTLRFGLSNENGLKMIISDRDHKIEELNHKCQTLERELNHLRRTQEELQSSRGDQADRMARYQESMLEVMKESARTHRREARRAHHNKQFELGHQTVMSTPMGQRDVWVHGNRMRELNSQLDVVSARIGYVENLKTAAERAKKNQVKAQQQRERDEDSAVGENSNGGLAGLYPFGQDLALMDYEEEIEKYKNELITLRQMETQMKSDLENAFATEKVSFLKEKARLQYEDQSEFASIPAIGNGRYVLMYLLGKGGFSEVWRAFDLREGRHVACKIHRTRKEWSHQARETYMRHARRELDIQRSLDHPRLTRLYDVFECNPNTENGSNPNHSNMALDSAQITGESIFVSVMEYSAGDDLDTHLRKFRTLREVDARIIFMQIVSCLRHLAEQKEPIIHYDLKPANILFHSALSTCLDIKITDFGLSKIIAEGAGSEGDNRIDLTSPGAGTYWYLPPECFSETSNSKISPKVDIWAAGVIFFQMLYGKRPFADGESQRRIWQEQLIVRNANKLEFPDKPAVSEAAKALIRRCLTPNEDERPDIIQLSNDPYLRQPSRRKRGGAIVTGSAASSSSGGGVGSSTTAASTAITGAGVNGLMSGVGVVGGGMMLNNPNHHNNNNNNNGSSYFNNLVGGGGPRVPPQPQLGMDFKVPTAPK